MPALVPSARETQLPPPTNVQATTPVTSPLLRPAAPSAARMGEARAYIAREDGIGKTLRRAARSHTDPAVVTAFAFLQTRPMPFYRRLFQRDPDTVRMTNFLRLVGHREVRDLDELEQAWKGIRRSSYIETRVNLANRLLNAQAPLSKAVSTLRRVDELWEQCGPRTAHVLDALHLYRAHPWFDHGWWLVADALLTQDESTHHCIAYLRQEVAVLSPSDNDAQAIAQVIPILRNIRPNHRNFVLGLFSQTLGPGQHSAAQRLDTLRAISQLPLATSLLVASIRHRGIVPGLPTETTEDTKRRLNVQADIARLAKLLPRGRQIAPAKAVSAVHAYIDSPAARKLDAAHVEGLGPVKTLARAALQTMVATNAAALNTLSIAWSIVEAPNLGSKTPTGRARADMRYALVSALARTVKGSGGELVCANGQNQRIVGALYGHDFGLAGEADQLRATPAELVCALTRELAREHENAPSRDACLAHYQQGVRKAARMYANNAEHLTLFEASYRQAFHALDWPIPGVS